LFDEGEVVEEEAVAEVETSVLLFMSNVEEEAEDAFSVVLDRSAREVVVVVVARRGDEEEIAATTGFFDSRFFRFVVAMPLAPPPRVEENERCACVDIGKDTLECVRRFF
jgi:hypothetical protein